MLPRLALQRQFEGLSHLVEGWPRVSGFRFRVVDDSELPAPHQWALIDDRGTVVAVVKMGALGPQVVAEVVAAYRSRRPEPEVAVPLQRGHLATRVS